MQLSLRDRDTRAAVGTWRGRIIEEYHSHQGTEQVTSHPVQRRRRLDETSSNNFEGNHATPRPSNCGCNDSPKYACYKNSYHQVRYLKYAGLADELERRDFFVRINTALDNPNRVKRLFFALLVDYVQSQSIQYAVAQHLWSYRKQHDISFFSGEKEEYYTWGTSFISRMCRLSG